MTTLLQRKKQNDAKIEIINYFGNDYSSFFDKYVNFNGNGADNKGEIKAVCPFPKHNDTEASLSINIKTGLFYCHGCSKKGDIFDFFGLLKNLTPKNDFLKILNGIKTDFGLKVENQIIDEYIYFDEYGEKYSKVVRYEPKNFRQFRFENQQWKSGLNNLQPIPYNLPELIKSDTVIIVEGEKDCDNLNSLGFVATTLPMGAGKWFDGIEKWFDGKTVYLIPDNDDAGRAHINQVACKLWNIADSIKIIDLSNDVADKGDITDLIQAIDDNELAGETINILIDDCPALRRKPDIEELKLQQDKKLDESINFVLWYEIKNRECVWGWPGYYEKRSSNIWDGEAYTGKTNLQTLLSCHHTVEIELLGDILLQCDVYWLAGESPQGISNRIQVFCQRYLKGNRQLNIFISHRPADLSNEEEINSIIYRVSEISKITKRPPGKIVIDTVAMNFGLTGDIVNVNDLRKYMFICSKLRDSLDCTVDSLTHQPESHNRPLGGKTQIGNVDGRFEIRQIKGKTYLIPWKVRNQPLPNILSFDTLSIELENMFDNKGKPMTAPLLVQPKSIAEKDREKELQEKKSKSEIKGNQLIIQETLKLMLKEAVEQTNPLKKHVTKDDLYKKCIENGMSQPSAYRNIMDKNNNCLSKLGVRTANGFLNYIGRSI